MLAESNLRKLPIYNRRITLDLRTVLRTVKGFLWQISNSDQGKNLFFWGWIFGWCREGFISSARKESTDADFVRKFSFSLHVSDLFQLFCFEFLPNQVALLGK